MNYELLLNNELTRLEVVRSQMEQRILYNIRHGLKNEQKDFDTVYAVSVAIESLEKVKKGE